VWYAIQHLNDGHNPNDGASEPWSRERIADWLETLDADLRVADAPVLRGGDHVRGRISQAHGVVVAEFDRDYVVVHWTRSGLTQNVAMRDLVLVEPEKKPVLKPTNQTFQPGDTVLNPVTKEFGHVKEVKSHYSLDYDTNVLELKIEWPTHVDIMPASAVQKFDPDQSYGSAQPPLDLGDIVSLAAGGNGATGKVTQYSMNSNDPSITYTVTWTAGGQSTHTRDELVLVEAYEPPEPEIGSWGSKKITKTDIY
jgi:hypothetical protein